MTLLENIPAAKNRAHPDYLKLVERFPLRSVDSKREHDAALEVLKQLVGFKLSRGEEDYMAALAALVEKYETEHFADNSVSPAEILAALMEHRGTTQKDLARMLGASAASMLLTGERTPSKEQAKALAAFFRVDAGVFL